MGFLKDLRRLLVREEAEGEEPSPEGAALEGVEPRHLTDEEFNAAIQEGVTLVDFWAEWCGPCHVLAPTIDALASAYNGRALVAKLNVDEYPQVAGQLGIMGIPTTIIFKDGEEVQRFVGVQGYDRIAQALETALDT